MNDDLISRSEILDAIEMAERMSHTSYPKMSFTKRDIVALIKSANAKTVGSEPAQARRTDRDSGGSMGKGTCNWHNPDKTGKYFCARFESPDGKQVIDMYFNGAQITLRMEVDGVEAARMKCPINYCPVCGERVGMERVSGAVD